MAKKPKDTDYLYISTRLRALETNLLTRERMERMLEAKTNQEAAKVLSECGYEGLEPLTEATLNTSLSARREEVFQEVSEYCPNKALVDVFRIKYDYHNAKVQLKCGLTGADPSNLIIDAGIYNPAESRKLLQGDENVALSEPFKAALLHSQEVLSATGDAQRSDMILDRACYEEIGEIAAASRSDFLIGYVRLQIDALNLRCAVRSLRRKKDMDFLKNALLPGGNVDREQIIALCLSGGELSSLYDGLLKEAATLGDIAKNGGRQTEFEKVCDNALGAYVKDCHMIPFGDAVVVAYLCAIENEIAAARIIMSGRLSGISTAFIRERLRDVYV